MRDAGFLRGLPYPTRDFVHDDIVVGRVAAQQATEADDGMVFSSLGEGAGGGGDFERAGNTDDGDVFIPGPGTKQSVMGAPQQPFSNKLIEPGDNDSEAIVSCVQLAGNGFLPSFAFVALFCGFAWLW